MYPSIHQSVTGQKWFLSNNLSLSDQSWYRLNSAYQLLESDSLTMLHCSMAAYWKCAKHPFKYLRICILRMPSWITRTLMSCMVQTPKQQLCLHSNTWTISYADMFNIPGANDALTLHYSSIIMSMMVSQIISAAIVYTTVCSGIDQRKQWKLHVTGLCEGNSRWPVNSPHKRPVMWKMLPFDGVIMSFVSFLILHLYLMWTCLKSLVQTAMYRMYICVYPSMYLSFCPMTHPHSHSSITHRYGNTSLIARWQRLSWSRQNNDVGTFHNEFMSS